MSEYTRGQEREEKRRIGAGMRTSVFACLLCWVPFLGVILASAGVVKVFGTITRRYQRKFRVGVAVSLIALALTLFMTTFEAYQYFHNPWLVDDVKSWLLGAVTGGEYDGYDYSNRTNPSMGMTDDLYNGNYTADGYYNDKGEFVPYAEASAAPVGSDETGG